MQKFFQMAKVELSKLAPWQIAAQVICGFLLATAVFWSLHPHF